MYRVSFQFVTLSSKCMHQNPNILCFLEMSIVNTSAEGFESNIAQPISTSMSYVKRCTSDAKDFTCCSSLYLDLQE